MSMFNPYIWKLYLDAGGKEVVSFFEENLCDNFTETFGQKICQFHKSYCPAKTITDGLSAQLDELCEGVRNEDYGFLSGCFFLMDLSENEYSIDEVMGIFSNGFRRESMSDKQVFCEFSDSIAYYTTFLTMAFPDLFVPYYFQYNYNILEKIAQEFEISLPTYPGKREYLARVLHYGKICTVLQDFRTEYHLSSFELMAFLYDFAPKYIGGVDSYIVKNLPEPKAAFFIGAKWDDCFLQSDSDTEETVCWQCSPDTRAGDVVVMYLRSPVSAVDSIWRSVSIGFVDPLSYYYRLTYISQRKKIEKTPLERIKQDEKLSRLSIVHKNMQGINGVELYPSDFNRLLDLSGCELPRLTYAAGNTEDIFQRERDVEDKRIKPFLQKLGYAENDYCQQLYIEIGNHNHALIPDFVIQPRLSAGHYFAAFLIEAKLSIPSRKLLEEAKTQARGYAKLLSTRYSIVAAKEGIWVSQAQDDFTADILSYSWEELSNEDYFYKVYRLLGKGIR